MAMALSTHGGFDDDFFGLPLAAMLTGAMRNSDGNVGNRGIALDVKEVGITTILPQTPSWRKAALRSIPCIADYRAPDSTFAIACTSLRQGHCVLSVLSGEPSPACQCPHHVLEMNAQPIQHHRSR